MDRVEETKKVRKLVPESMSSNPQPEQKGRERRKDGGVVVEVVVMGCLM